MNLYWARKRKLQQTPAIVISRVLTGLATVRSLGLGGVPVYVVYFDRADPVRFSSFVTRAIYFDEERASPEDLLDLIEGIAQALSNRPVLIATSDRDILLFGAHFQRLERCTRLWGNALHTLLSVVTKEGLYRLAKSCELPLIPSCAGSDPGTYQNWLVDHPGPYIVKIERNTSPFGRLAKYNVVLDDAAQVLRLLDGSTKQNAVIQQFIEGGDGYIFDAYGFTSRDGRMRSFASHRRWRQLPPHFGTTTYGEIPVRGMGDLEQRIHDSTERLLARAAYHGVFGIEWLLDRRNGELYLIDFNARPFLSIGHLTDCGLNLPLLAYQELLGCLPPDLPPRPRLRHRYWVDLLRDLEAVDLRGLAATIERVRRFGRALACGSRAYASLRDPLPALVRARQMLQRLARRVRRPASGPRA